MLLAREQWDWCLRRQILSLSEYLRGDDMITHGADLQSRQLYTMGEWQLKTKWFQKIQDLWGPHTVDAFASRVV